MNCFYHPEVASTAVCTSCGKGLCQDCATNSLNGLCYDCAATAINQEKKNLIVDFVIYAIGLIIGAAIFIFLLLKGEWNIAWYEYPIYVFIGAGLIPSFRFVFFSMSNDKKTRNVYYGDPDAVAQAYNTEGGIKFVFLILKLVLCLVLSGFMAIIYLIRLIVKIVKYVKLHKLYNIVLEHYRFNVLNEPSPMADAVGEDLSNLEANSNKEE